MTLENQEAGETAPVSAEKPENVQEPKKIPLTFDGLYETGCNFLKKSMPEAALKNLELALEMKPNNVEANRAVIRCYNLIRKKNPRRAGSIREKLRTACARLEGQYHGLILTFCKIGDFRKAMPLYEELKRMNADYRSKHDEEFYEAYQKLGEEEAEQKKFRKAVDCFDKAILIAETLESGRDKKLARSFHALAVTHDRAKKADYAIGYYKRALELDPKLTDPCAARIVELHRKNAFIYEKREQYDKVIENLQHAMRFDPKNVKLLDQLGRAYQKKKNFRKALDCFLRGDELQPQDIRTYIRLAQTYRALGENEKSEEYGKKVEELKALEEKAAQEAKLAASQAPVQDPVSGKPEESRPEAVDEPSDATAEKPPTQNP